MVFSFQIEDDDLCERLGGGLPQGSLVIIQGPNGTGKSVISQRLVEGLLQKEHKVTYVSTELTTKGFFAQMDSLGYKSLHEAVPEERLVFLPTHPSIGARAPRGERLERLVKARRMYENDVIIIDAFSKFLRDHIRDRRDDGHAMDEVEAVLHLFKRLTGTGRTVLLTIDPHEADQPAIEPFIESADVLLNLEKQIIGNSGVRRIVVERMSRAENRYNEVIGYRVEPGVGIVIEIKAVVG